MDYKSILRCRLIGLKVGVDSDNKAHILEIFNRENAGGESPTPPTPTGTSNLVDGEGTYSVKQKNILANSVAGSSSIAFGGGNNVSGNSSFAAGGVNKLAHGTCLALGNGLESNKDNQVLVGCFNYPSNITGKQIKFVVGNGVDVNNKKNAIEVWDDDKIYVCGVGGYNGTNSGQSGVKDLATVISENVPVVPNIDCKFLKYDGDDGSLDTLFTLDGVGGVKVTVEDMQWLKDNLLKNNKPTILQVKTHALNSNIHYYNIVNIGDINILQTSTYNICLSFTHSGTSSSNYYCYVIACNRSGSTITGIYGIDVYKNGQQINV